MSLERHLEQEVKFDVNNTTALPDLSTLAWVDTIDSPAVYELDATYFDTPELTLSAHKATLRRRTGGKDAGWHLKTTSESGREEVHHPLSDEVPKALYQLVQPWIGNSALIEVATVRNTRTETVLRDANGNAVAEFCDDRVQASSPTAGEQQWREWEVEATEYAQEQGSAQKVLEEISRLLRDAGAQEAARASKLQRALHGTERLSEGDGA